MSVDEGRWSPMRRMGRWQRRGEVNPVASAATSSQVIRAHLPGILAWTRLRISNGALEGMNKKVHRAPRLRLPRGRHLHHRRLPLLRGPAAMTLHFPGDEPEFPPCPGTLPAHALRFAALRAVRYGTLWAAAAQG